MTNWKLGWKVFSQELKDYYSLYRMREDEGRTHYHPWVVYPLPGCGPFTVFKTYEGCLYLLENAVPKQGMVIKRVWFIPSKGERVFCALPYRKSLSVLDLEQTNRSILLPGETVLADAIMIAD